MKYYLPRRIYLHQLLHGSKMSLQEQRVTAFFFEAACRLYRLRRNPYRRRHFEANALFVHIPKTGGNSIKRIIYGVDCGGTGLHTAAWEYRAHSAEIYDRLFVFAAVRHPLLRLTSAFAFLKCGGMTREDEIWSGRWLRRYDDVKALLRALDDDAERKRIMHWTHFIPQRYFLCDFDGRPIVDHLVRTENFAADMRRVCDRLHLPYCERHDNVTQYCPSTTASFDEETVRRCYALYRDDYELLGYEPWPSTVATPAPAAATA
jgi:chondroitin 4-sulfotransferase 11